MPARNLKIPIKSTKQKGFYIMILEEQKALKDKLRKEGRLMLIGEDTVLTRKNTDTYCRKGVLRNPYCNKELCKLFFPIVLNRGEPAEGACAMVVGIRATLALNARRYR